MTSSASVDANRHLDAAGGKKDENARTLGLMRLSRVISSIIASANGMRHHHRANAPLRRRVWIRGCDWGRWVNTARLRISEQSLTIGFRSRRLETLKTTNEFKIATETETFARA